MKDVNPDRVESREEPVGFVPGPDAKRNRTNGVSDG
jgi:hypothetical protein